MDRSRRRLAVVAGLALSIAVLYVLSPRLLTAWGALLVHEDPLERTDAIIVLAPMLDRVVEAARLYGEGYAPLVILTREPAVPVDLFLAERGVAVESSEEERRRALIALGVPDSAITILPRPVTSTADEAQFFAEWARAHPVRSVTVVTSPPHTGRARLVFQRTLRGTGIEVRVRPSTLHEFRADTWWRGRATLRDTLYESQKLVYYWMFE